MSKVYEIYGQCKYCLDGFTVEVAARKKNGQLQYIPLPTRRFQQRPDGTFFHDSSDKCRKSVVKLYGILPTLTND